MQGHVLTSGTASSCLVRSPLEREEQPLTNSERQPCSPGPSTHAGSQAPRAWPSPATLPKPSSSRPWPSVASPSTLLCALAPPAKDSRGTSGTSVPGGLGLAAAPTLVPGHWGLVKPAGEAGGGGAISPRFIGTKALRLMSLIVNLFSENHKTPAKQKGKLRRPLSPEPSWEVGIQSLSTWQRSLGSAPPGTLFLLTAGKALPQPLGA